MAVVQKVAVAAVIAREIMQRRAAVCRASAGRHPQQTFKGVRPTPAERAVIGFEEGAERDALHVLICHGADATGLPVVA